MRYEAVVIGVSAGGLEALRILLGALPLGFPLPIAIVQHREPRPGSFLTEYLDRISPLAVSEAEEKAPLQAGHVYLAPAGYHLLIEQDKSFSLSVDPRVNHSCPSVDVLFESAADAFGAALIGIVLTGANYDGADGLNVIKQKGGLAIVQNPETAEARTMPLAALAVTAVDHMIHLEQIAPLLVELTSTSQEKLYGTTR